MFHLYTVHSWYLCAWTISRICTKNTCIISIYSTCILVLRTAEPSTVTVLYLYTWTASRRSTAEPSTVTVLYLYTCTASRRSTADPNTVAMDIPIPIPTISPVPNQRGNIKRLIWFRKYHRNNESLIVFALKML